jgi:hypothetical protein
MKIQQFTTGTRVHLNYAFSSQQLSGVVRARSTSSNKVLVIFDDNRLEWVKMQCLIIEEPLVSFKVNMDPTGFNY